MRARIQPIALAVAVMASMIAITAVRTPVGAVDTVGMVNPDTGEWQINHGGFLDRYYFGDPGDFPVFGDWDCDGIDTPGMYRQSDGFVYLRNSNSQGIADIKFYFGDPSDVPLAGDWNGDGCDTLSIYRASEQRFYIINRLGQNDGGLGPADFSFSFGNPGDKPFAGDFDGDGITEVGLHRESTGFVYYRNSLTTGVADNLFFFGDPGDRLIAGDWNLNGTDSPALFRPYPGGELQSNSPGKYYFRFTNSQGNADLEFCASFGWEKGLPIAGDIGKAGPAGNFEDCTWNPGMPTTTTTQPPPTTTTQPSTTTTTTGIPPPPTGGWNPASCTYDGIPMWGSVYITDFQLAADVTVYETSFSFAADLIVELQDFEFLADSCGEWYLTDFELLSDFTIYVTDFELLSDLTIYVW